MVVKLLQLLVFIIFIQVNLDAQTLSPKAKNWMTEAKKLANKGDFKNANKKLSKIIDGFPQCAEAYMRMGSNYYSLGEDDLAERYFNKVIMVDSTFSPEVFFSLGIVQMRQKKYLESAKNFSLYSLKEDVPDEKKHKAQRLSENMTFTYNAVLNPKPFHPESLGEGVNSSKYSEYSPSLSFDESAIIFTKNIGQEDMYFSTKDSLDRFTVSIPMDHLNTYQNEGAHSFSADGRFMVFTACDRKESLGGCDLYYSNFVDGQWSKPKNMGKDVNSPSWDSQPCISPDGKTLYFSSNRSGTYGGSDIWMSKKSDSGTWQKPENLGASINTKYREETPFMHPDGKTLYFRSDGYPGMGDFDIYFSRYSDETKTWSKPENLGFPINTSGAEGGLIVSLDGKTAYFASDINPNTQENLGQLDIYKFELYEDARPKPTTFIKGIVQDAETGKTIENAVIRITSLDHQQESSTFYSRSEGGFLGSLTAGESYSYHVEHPNYIFYSDFFDLTALDSLYKPYELNIKLQPIPVEETQAQVDSKPTVLKNIFFEFGSSEILPQSFTEIDKLYRLLELNPNSKIKILGHTDDVGSDQDNILLSQQRAEAVRQKLISMGVNPLRIIALGYGESQPIASNDTDDGRRSNRRTEFILFY